MNDAPRIEPAYRLRQSLAAWLLHPRRAWRLQQAWATYLRLAGSTRVPGFDAAQLGRGWQLPAENVDFPLAYKLLPSINFCVSLIQEVIAALPLDFYQTRGDVAEKLEREPGNIVDLWATANGQQTGYELVEDLVGSLLLQGNAYLFKEYMGTARVRQLWVLDPTKVEPVPGPNRTVTGYMSVENGSRRPIPVEQVVHFRRYDPQHGVLGVSVMTSLRLSYETERDRGRLMRAFFEKGGVAPGYFQADMAISVDDRIALEEHLGARYQNLKHAWDAVILPSTLKYQRAGLTMDEMQFIDSHKLTLQDILMAFKIPISFAGLMDGAGMNSDVMRVAFMMRDHNAILPLCRRIQSTLNECLLAPSDRFLAGEFGPDLTCKFDTSGLPSSQQILLEHAEAFAKATGGPVMLRSEARQRLGLEQLDDPRLDEMLVPIAVSAAGEPGTGTEAPPAAGPRRMTATRVGRLSRDQLRVRASSLLRLHERRFERGVRQVFASQERRIIERLKAQVGARGARSINVDDLLTYSDADRKALQRKIRDIVRERGEEALAELALDMAFDVTASEVSAWIMAKGARLVTLIDDTTRSQLRDALAAGVQANEGMAELVARVREVMAGRKNDAATIARTETAGAYNFGSVEAWKESGVVASKEWLTAGDEAVRDSHLQAEADGPVSIDADFNVGGEPMAYPGDPRGSAGEVINCRCSMVPVVIDMGQGVQEAAPAAVLERMNGRAGAVPLEELLGCSQR